MSELTPVAGNSLVDVDTGEVLTLPVNLVEALDGYARLQAEATVARLDFEESLAGLLEAHPMVAELKAHAESLELRIETVRESLGEMRPTDDPNRSVTVDTGRVRVTWPKGRTVAKITAQGRALADVLAKAEAGDVEAGDVAHYLGLKRTTGTPPGPIITVRQ